MSIPNPTPTRFAFTPSDRLDLFEDLDGMNRDDLQASNPVCELFAFAFEHGILRGPAAPLAFYEHDGGWNYITHLAANTPEEIRISTEYFDPSDLAEHDATGRALAEQILEHAVIVLNDSLNRLDLYVAARYARR